MVYNISVSDSKIIYTPLSSISDGISYFNGTYKPVRHEQFTLTTSTGSYYAVIISVNKPQIIHYSNIVVWHLYGTITRDITDNTAFYQLLNKYSEHDPTMIIPCDQYTNTSIIDFTDFATYYDVNYYYFWFFLKTFDKDYNALTTSSRVDITLDYYCL